MISLSHKLSPYVQPLMNLMAVIDKIKTARQIERYLDLKEEMINSTRLEF